MRIPVVIEQGEAGFSAYAPDVPGCVAAASTREETLELMRGALEMHLRGLMEDGEQLPDTPTSVEILEVSAA
jgi:predicted RNase H-like HicB family nuclease